jgi:hypothetical protein
MHHCLEENDIHHDSISHTWKIQAMQISIPSNIMMISVPLFSILSGREWQSSRRRINQICLEVNRQVIVY